jgi:argininosuccinate lyase
MPAVDEAGRDLQEDKESLFDAFDTAEASLQALTTLVAEIERFKNDDQCCRRKASATGSASQLKLDPGQRERGYRKGRVKHGA